MTIKSPKRVWILIFSLFLSTHVFANIIDVENRIDILYQWFRKMGNPDTATQAIDKAKIYKPQVTASKYPAVIFLHGCTGITSEESNWARLLSDAGYYVLMPNSFARSGRKMNCNPKDPAMKNGAFQNAYAYRQEEISAAFDVLVNNSTIDASRIFLIGFSEGAVATAQTIQKGLRAQVILAWTCTVKGLPNFSGINQLEDIPVLAVSATADPWRVGTNNEGRCMESLHSLKSLKQIDVDGAFHELFLVESVRKEVLVFLEATENK